MNGDPDDVLGSGLPVKVVERLRSEFGPGAEQIVRCLRTARALIEQAKADDHGLRLAESAAYNIRQALDTVTVDQTAADGGLKAVMKAWRQYRLEVDQADADVQAARALLDDVLSEVESDAARASHRARQLLTYLLGRAGVAPTTGRDPVSEYADLRARANAAVHTKSDLVAVTSLLNRTLEWFAWLFTPPDDVVLAIRALATQPWQGAAQMVKLQQLVTNDHHLRLFFTEVTDPAWLEPLRSAGLVRLPTPNSGWPVGGLVFGLGRTHADTVAALLEELLVQTKHLPVDERPAVRWELLWAAFHLGAPGHTVVAEVTEYHPALSGVRALSVDAALKADPTDLVVYRVADALLKDLDKFADASHTTQLLDRLQAGVTKDNLAQRTRMLAGKTQRLAGTTRARFTYIGTQALTVQVGEYPEPLLLLAHNLVCMLSTARELGVPAPTLLEWLKKVPGRIGDRVRCQVLAGADDIPVADKIHHITRRLASSTATGDDLALVSDILARDPDNEHILTWTDALGSPSPGDGEGQFPRDWERAWSWSAVLPAQMLTGWRDPIAHVSARWGEPDLHMLTGDRPDLQQAIREESPYSADYLATLPVLKAAELVASWRPDPTDNQHRYTSTALAYVLQETIKRSPAQWSVEATTVVTTLQELRYVLPYLRAVTATAADIVDHAPALLGAAAHIRTSGLTTTPSDTTGLGEGHDLTDVEAAVLAFVRALADNNADIAANLDELWEWALAPVRRTPDTDPALTFMPDDPFNSAMSQPWGEALLTVAVLANWEFRRTGSIRSEFEHTLDTITRIPGDVGLEFRAILAWLRPLLERIALPWLDAHAAVLLRDGELGQPTFDLTVTWAQPTSWLYQHFKTELFAAAGRVSKGRSNRSYRPSCTKKLATTSTTSSADSAGRQWPSPKRVSAFRTSSKPQSPIRNSSL